MGGEARFLIVEDDETIQRVVCRYFLRFGPARGVSTIAEASDACTSEAWTGLVLDVGLPDGDGLDWLARVRAVGSMRRALSPRLEEWFAATLVLSGVDGDEVRVRSEELGATFLEKPGECAQFGQFARYAIAGEHLAAPAAQCVAAEAHRLGLSTMETRVLCLEVSGLRRKDWPEILRISSSTVRTHVERSQAKARLSLRNMARPIIQAVMTGRPVGGACDGAPTGDGGQFQR